MRYVIRCLLAALMAMMLCMGAMADAAFIPEMQTWDWYKQPVEVTLGADVQTHMPYDENRTGQLNALLKHMNLRIHLQQSGGQRWNSMTLLLDGQDVLKIMQREMPGKTEAQFSSMPHTTYVWNQEAGIDLNTLLGGTTSELWVDGSEAAWLDDALKLFDALPQAFMQHLKDAKHLTKVEGMGDAVRRQTLIIPQNALDGLGEKLAALCPEGRLKLALETAVFSGKQTVNILRDEQGGILRIEWVGNAGLRGDELRQVSLVWRLKRAENESKDDLTFKAPYVRGSGRDNMTLQRTITVDGDQAQMQGKMVTNTLVKGPKCVMTTEFNLVRTLEDGHSRVNGEVNVQRQIGDEKDYDRIVLQPDVTFAGTADAPVLEGAVTVSQYRSKSLTDQAKITLRVKAAEWLRWELRSSQVRLDETNRYETMQRLINGMTVDLVRRLVLLPEEDTLFLSADLDPAVWAQIVQAAQSALQ